MKKRTLTTALLGIATALTFAGPMARAQESVDASTEAEEVMADSEAAVTVARAAKVRAAKEQAENRRTLREANKARNAAEAKKQAAAEEQTLTDEKIQALLIEQRKTKGEIKRLEARTAASEKSIQDNKARVQQATQETEALHSQRDESQTKLANSKKERDQLMQQSKELESQKAQADAQLQKARDEEIAGARLLKITQREEARKAIKLNAQISQLKEQYRVSRSHSAELEKQTAQLHQETARLEAVAQTGKREIQTVVPTADQPVATTPALVLKRDCKIHDGPDTHAKVLGVKLSGEAVPRVSSDSGWVAFPYSSAQQGFVSHACF